MEPRGVWATTPSSQAKLAVPDFVVERLVERHISVGCGICDVNWVTRCFRIKSLRRQSLLLGLERFGHLDRAAEAHEKWSSIGRQTLFAERAEFLQVETVGVDRDGGHSGAPVRAGHADAIDGDIFDTGAG